MVREFMSLALSPFFRYATSASIPAALNWDSSRALTSHRHSALNDPLDAYMFVVVECRSNVIQSDASQTHFNEVESMDKDTPYFCGC